MIKLTVDFVPETAWLSNICNYIKKRDWDSLKETIYTRAYRVCEICNCKIQKNAFKCHQHWSYNDHDKVQTLIQLLALCPSCYELKHIGFTNTSNRYKRALSHLAKINQWAISEAENYINHQLNTWLVRNQYKWSLDISLLVKFGLKYENKNLIS